MNSTQPADAVTSRVHIGTVIRSSMAIDVGVAWSHGSARVELVFRFGDSPRWRTSMSAGPAQVLANAIGAAVRAIENARGGEAAAPQPSPIRRELPPPRRPGEPRGRVSP